MFEENKNIKDFGDKLSKPIIQYKGNIKIKTWSSAKQAEREEGFNSSSIRDVCVGRRKSHKGFKWRYEDEDDIFNQKNGNIGIKKPIKCIYANGEEVIFESKKEASLKLNIKETTIQNIVLNKTKQKKEFTLTYGTN